MAKILVLDDDSRTASFLCQHLNGAGHKCLVAADGETALNAAKTEMPDLLILDVMIPGGPSGFEICRRIRADSDLYTLPIMLLSAMSNDEEVSHGLAQGADDYVTKPFDINNVLRRVESLLRTNADVHAIDDTTSLPGAAAVKREVQKRVCRQEVFSLACIELMRLREFGFKLGGDARNRVVRHLARGLTVCASGLSEGEFVAGHMGGGYFACLLNPEHAEPYCLRVQEVWQSHLASLYDHFNMGEAYRQVIAGKPDKGFPLLSLLVCVTTHHQRDILSSQELFEILMKMRNNALASNSPGVHFDRRA